MSFHDDEDEDAPKHFRKAALKALAVIYPAVVHATAAKNIGIGLAQVRFALGLEDRSMRDVAASLNVSVECISKGAKAFVRENNLPIPSCMRSEEASASYREARERKLKPNDPDQS